ncbi:MAG: AAA family ATPase [Desulfomonile tiedjei]|uniref:AAA family ATPase n=1 Tax=Desulfomonile tiedjei TaxID=2358 RepID=A0A9D6V7B8_9BACT|nr:AAA family ATPase [Desulfomonile tiedjei]
MELVLLIGVQASGKSTFFKKRFVDTHVRINLDMLRTRSRERILFEACIQAKQPMVVDNTNPTEKDRARYITPAKKAGFKITGYYFQTAIQESIKRNRLRPYSQIIPIKGIAATCNRLELPNFQEGFDELYRVILLGRGKFGVKRSVESDTDAHSKK